MPNIFQEVMSYYTIPQCPEILFEVIGIDSNKTRFNVAKQIANLVNEGSLKIKIPEGFSTSKLIEIKEKDLMSQDDSKIIEAVKVISKLSFARQRTQELHDQALIARQKIDILFDPKVIEKDEFEIIKEKLKIIENFAKANLSYKEALIDAEVARSVIDEALTLIEQ